MHELRRNLTHPIVIAGVAIVLADAPEDRTGFDQVIAEGHHGSVFALNLKEEHQGAPRKIMPAHGIEELNDGSTFGSDGRVHPGAGGNRTIRFQSVSVHLDMNQSRSNHLVDPRLRHSNGRSGAQFFIPIRAAFGMPVIEGLLRQFQCPLMGNRPVGKQDLEGCSLARRNHHTQFRLGQRGAVESADAEDTDVVIRAESVLLVIRPLRAAISIRRVQGNSRLEPGIAGNGPGVRRRRPQKQHRLFVPAQFRLGQPLQLLLLFIRHVRPDSVGIGEQPGCALNRVGGERTLFQGGEGRDIIAYVFIHDRTVNNGQYMVFQPTGIVVNAHLAATQREGVLDGLVVPVRQRCFRVVQTWTNVPLVRLGEIEFEDSKVTCQSKPGRTICRPGVGGGGIKILLRFSFNALPSRLPPFASNVLRDLLERPAVGGFRHRRAVIGKKDRIGTAYISEKKTERRLWSTDGYDGGIRTRLKVELGEREIEASRTRPIFARTVFLELSVRYVNLARKTPGLPNDANFFHYNLPIVMLFFVPELNSPHLPARSCD